MADEITVTDAAGRVIKCRELDPADMLNLAELGGDKATDRWMQLAMMMFGVTSIGGIPTPPCTTKAHILSLAKQIGNAGLVALRRELLGLTEAEAAVEQAKRDAGETADPMPAAPPDVEATAKN